MKKYLIIIFSSFLNINILKSDKLFLMRYDANTGLNNKHVTLAQFSHYLPINVLQTKII